MFECKHIIVYNKNVGFALKAYEDFRRIEILNSPTLLDFIYFNEDQRSKSHGERLRKFILQLFQILKDPIPASLGFCYHIGKDSRLEIINTYPPITTSFISSHLTVNRQPSINRSIGEGN